MSDPLEAILKDAKRDRYGNVAIAHLRRQDEDAWDALVVAEDSQPLVFWATGDRPDIEDVVVREDGAFLMVVVSTPPGVRPAGLITTPANAWGSPLASLVSLVSPEGITMVSPPRESSPAAPPPPVGTDMLRSLLDKAAAHESGGFRVTELETADGGFATVLLDWDGRPLMFWVEMPRKNARTLMTAIILPGEEGGIVAMAVDAALQPLYSGAKVTEGLAGDGREQEP